MDQQTHHSFVDLDQHESQTDAEALEAIRVAIGQSADFNTQPLSDVLHDQDQDGEHEPEHEQGDIELLPQAGGSGSTSSNGPLHGQLEKSLSELLEVSQASLWEIETAIAPASRETLMRIQGHGKKHMQMTKDLLEMVRQQPQGLNTMVDPILEGTHVSKADFDALQSKYDELSAGGAADNGRKSRKRARHSTQQDMRADSEMMDGEASSTPVDEKPRKKRGMKLEHLIHQQANQRLGIEYNVSKFESKGLKYLPDPSSTPLLANQSPNMVHEMRPDFTQDVKAPTVRPFINQVVEDVIREWDGGVYQLEPVTTHEKIREAVEVYWVRLAKRWNEQCIRAQGGIHKDELVRRKQNQYRRQQSLVARRQAAFDQSPLNLCKLRSLYRTLLTLDFASKTDERPNPDRAYTTEEWNAYRKTQYGSRAEEAHEVLDPFWISNTARSILCILDVFATDSAARLKRKGKPKGPAPGFHLPAELWDRSNLPLLRRHDNDGLPIPGIDGIILFRFQVDERVAAEFPEWAQGLYDNPPIPEGDNLLPSLNEVMNSNAYQHLKPLVKLTREAFNVPRLSAQEVEVINAQPAEEITATITPILDAFAKTEPLQDLSNVNLDLSLDTLVNMTENHYMAAGSLDSQLAQFDSATDNGNIAASAAGTPSKPPLGTSVHARKMGKKIALPPGGAATPVAKRFKTDGQTMGQSAYNEAEEDLVADAGFLEAL